MMFSRALALTSMVSLSVLAAATPGGAPHPTTTITVKPGPTSVSEDKCNTGKLQCCNQLQNANDPAMATLLTLVGVAVQGVNVIAGLDCSPITVVGVGAANSCNAHAVCCKDNNVGGVASIGCVPVTV